jgi:hypothetical protein
MSEMSDRSKERLTELLADRATEGLSPEEQTELDNLLDNYPEWEQSQLDLAAAALSLTDLKTEEPLPSRLRSKVLSEVYHQMDMAEAQSADKDSRDAKSNDVITFPKSNLRWQYAGWIVAAACLVIAVAGWWSRLQTQTLPVSAAEMRARLIAEAPDLVQTDWSATNDKDAAGVRGDVIWSNSLQRGFMRFQGLPMNDPQIGEYQLWIFDAKRDERFPIDGGVFSIDHETGEVIVSINAKLKVSEPTLFAITVEKPGGTVVSKRDRLVLTAKAK